MSDAPERVTMVGDGGPSQSMVDSMAESEGHSLARALRERDAERGRAEAAERALAEARARAPAQEQETTPQTLPPEEGQAPQPRVTLQRLGAVEYHQGVQSYGLGRLENEGDNLRREMEGLKHKAGQMQQQLDSLVSVKGKIPEPVKF